jgi:small-conductance mechanosensitive channel
MRRLATVLSICLFAFLAVAMGPYHLQTMASAQDAAPLPDYEAWRNFATGVEDDLDSAAATTAELEAIRNELASWRGQFSGLQNINNSRISILNDQISALGPAPAEGAAEPELVAIRRAELTAQLAELQAPRLKADEAFLHADGLIGQVDNLIREREAKRLLELGPSPLNPTLWLSAFNDLGMSVAAIADEVAKAWNDAERRSYFANNLLVTGFYLLVAVVLLARGRRWMERLTNYVHSKRKMTRFRETKAFLVSLGQVLLPVAGIMLLTAALSSTRLFGERGTIVLANLPVLGISIFLARWLALRLFPKDESQGIARSMDTGKRAELRFYIGLLGPLFGLSLLLLDLAQHDDYSIASRAVLAFPVLVVMGVILFRLGTVIFLTQPTGAPSEMVLQAPEGESAGDLRKSMGAIFGRAMVVFGIAGPLLGAVGYNTAAVYFIFPTVLSIGLIGLLLVLQEVILDIYSSATRKTDEETRQALMPVMIGFGLVLLSLPVFALFWGARVSDLLEVWSKFKQGFVVAGIPISPVVLLKLAIVFSIGFGLTRLAQRGLRTTVLPKTKIDAGGRTAILSGLGYVGVFLSAVVAITSAGIDLSSLAIVAGALSVGIGFGLQTIVSNFVSGIILLIERPIAEGDWIEVAGQNGIVRDISVRSTRIETFDRTDVIVPNADLVSGVVTNWTRGNLIGRVRVPVGVAYGTDTRKVEKILMEIAEDHPLVAMNPPPAVVFMEFGPDSLNFEIRAILRDVNFVLATRSDMNHEIARRFAEEGIEIPFAQRDIWLRNPEALFGQGRKPENLDIPTPPQEEEPKT